MTQQTETYIQLKPIAERFSSVASEVTDTDIRHIIMDVMREKISQAIDFGVITDVMSEWIDDHSEEIVKAMKDSIAKRLDLPSNYRW